jgi:hypothetical protein
MMTINRANEHLGRGNVAQRIKPLVIALGLIGIGYVALTAANHAFSRPDLATELGSFGCLRSGPATCT